MLFFESISYFFSLALSLSLSLSFSHFDSIFTDILFTDNPTYSIMLENAKINYMGALNPSLNRDGGPYNLSSLPVVVMMVRSFTNPERANINL